MRPRILIGFTMAAFLGLASGGPARGEEAGETEAAAPSDPTRGQWDSFLDPLRDAEEEYVVGTQKRVEDASKVHLSLGINQTWTWDFNDPKDGTPLSYDSFLYHDSPSFSLGQLGVFRPSQGWFVPGFGVKLDVGKTARRIKADWDGDGAVDRGEIFETNDFDAQEAYLTWAVPEDSPALKGLTLKGGKFVTLLGAEVIEPWANFNNSRSFLFTFAIPFTHTGALATYPLTEKISVTAGPVMGWDNVWTNNNGWTGMGNITWTARDELTLAANGIFGPSQNDDVGNKRGVVDLVATIKPTPQLTFLLNYDWGHEDGAALDGGDAIWQGFAAVANYQMSDRASLAGRGEWFEDAGGSRTGIRQQLYGFTFTGRYDITQHLFGRLEYRLDVSSEEPFLDSHNLATESDQGLISIALTYVFN
jgi:hypothetical protein